MRYAYYPGCSLEATARPYEESVLAVAKLLGMDLVEIEDWNCCGATAYMNVNEVLSFCLSARNLAQARRTGDQVVTACSACFTNLRKTEVYLAESADIKEKVNQALGEAGMHYEGGMVIKHFLQVVVEDVGLDRIKALIKRPLHGLRVAPYYGCQIARPYGIEDDTDNPTMLDRLIETLGAATTYYPMKTMCCGGALMGTNEPVALRLCRNLLTASRSPVPSARSTSTRTKPRSTGSSRRISASRLSTSPSLWVSRSRWNLTCWGCKAVLCRQPMS
jgi:heterodisulfide reductase subunit B